MSNGNDDDQLALRDATQHNHSNATEWGLVPFQTQPVNPQSV